MGGKWSKSRKMKKKELTPFLHFGVKVSELPFCDNSLMMFFRMEVFHRIHQEEVRWVVRLQEGVHQEVVHQDHGIRSYP